MNTIVLWVRAHTVGAICVTAVITWLAQDIIYTLPPTIWLFTAIGVAFMIFLVLATWFLAVYFRQASGASSASSRNKMRRADCFEYHCPACGNEWTEDNLPKNSVCPEDFVPLKRRDLVEDRNWQTL